MSVALPLVILRRSQTPLQPTAENLDRLSPRNRIVFTGGMDNLIEKQPDFLEGLKSFAAAGGAARVVHGQFVVAHVQMKGSRWFENRDAVLVKQRRVLPAGEQRPV